MFETIIQLKITTLIYSSHKYFDISCRFSYNKLFSDQNVYKLSFIRLFLTSSFKVIVKKFVYPYYIISYLKHIM